MTLSSFLGRVGPIPVAAGLMIWFSLAVALGQTPPLEMADETIAGPQTAEAFPA